MFKLHFVLLVTCLLAIAPMASAQDPASQEDVANAQESINANITALTSSLETRLTGLLEQEAALVALMGNLSEGMLQVIKIQIKSANDTFDDNKVLYGAIVSLNNQLFLLRGDLDALNANVTGGFLATNKGVNKQLAVGDTLLSKGALLEILVGVSLLCNVFLAAFVTKRPKFLWRRLKWESQRVDNQGGGFRTEEGDIVQEVCPKEDEGLKFGQYFQCQFNDTCKVAGACKRHAIEATASEAAGAKGELETAGTPRAPAEEDLMADFGRQ